MTVTDLYTWWAERCGVPRGWVEELPLEGRDGALAFTWPGLEVVKLCAPSGHGVKSWWEPPEAPLPYLWPPLPDYRPPVAVLLEHEDDATLASWILRLWPAASVHATVSIGQSLCRGVMRELHARGTQAVLLVPGAGEASARWAERWQEAARAAGLAVGLLDLVAKGALAPSLGERQLRDAWLRRPDQVVDALLTEVDALTAALANENCFRPYIGDSWAETNSVLVTAADLLSRPQASTVWLWHGYLPRGGVTLLSARAKQGKTTLVAHLVRAMLQGAPFLGLETALGSEEKVAVLSEEPEGLVADRLRSLGLETERLLLAFKHRCHGRPLLDLVGEAIEAAAALVVVDTMAAWTGIEDENSAPEMEAALRPIISLCQEKGASLLLLHHLRKSDGPEGTAHRGSGHLVAMTDVALELRRPEGNAPAGRRVLKALSRYQETPEELVIELDDGAYSAVGSRKDMGQRQAREALLAVLPGPSEAPIRFEDDQEGDQEGEESIMRRLADAGLKVKRTTLQRALAELVASGRVERLGGGTRGDPFVYRLAPENSFPPNSHPIMGGNNSEAPGSLGQGQAAVTPTCQTCGAPGDYMEEASGIWWCWRHGPTPRL